MGEFYKTGFHRASEEVRYAIRLDYFSGIRVDTCGFL